MEDDGYFSEDNWDFDSDDIISDEWMSFGINLLKYVSKRFDRMTHKMG